MVNKNQNGFIQINFTIDSREKALEIANHLVDNGLAACAQLSGPITSVYRWKGEKYIEEEFRCTVKTRAGLFNLVEGKIKELHPYEVPEIISLPILDGNSDYLDWIIDNTKT